MTNDFNEYEQKSMKEYQDLLDEKEVFGFAFPEKIGVREYIGLRHFALVIKVVIAQVRYAEDVRRIPALEDNREYPLSQGFKRLRFANSLELPAKVYKVVKEHIINICESSLTEIENSIQGLHKSMERVIDPEYVLTSELEWDLYIKFLSHFDFGLNKVLFKQDHKYSLTIGGLAESLYCKYQVEEIEDALSVEGKLISQRLILLNMAGIHGFWSNIPLLVSDYARKALGSKNGEYLSKVSMEVNPAYSFSDLVLEEDVLADIKSLCNHQTGERPLTFLLQGPSGVGKTTLAHAIAKYLGKKMLQVSLRSSGKDDLELKLKYFCQLAKGQQYVLFFDEAEGLFRSSMQREETSGWARILFQEFKGIAIFTSNFSLPYGLDRRMTYSLRLKDMKAVQKVSIVEKYAQSHGFILSPEEYGMLAEIDLSPGYYESIFRLAKVRSSGFGSFETIRKAFLQRASYFLADESLEKYKKTKASQPKLYFSEELEAKLKPLRYGALKYIQDPKKFPRGLKAVFSGPPGVGKTAFASSIAADLKLDLKVVTPSDILSPYVGENEKNIRAIFEAPRAGEKAKILFLDEVESILLNRSFAQRGWELSMGNELLTRLDAYPGIIIAATNRYDLLDPAFKRRFLFHVEFTHPPKNVRRLIWEEKCKGISTEEVDKLSEFELTGADIEDICFKARTFWEMPFDAILNECSDVISSRRPLEKCITLV